MTQSAKNQLGFAIVLAITLLVGWRALADTVLLALGNDAFTYILLILPVSAVLIFQDWKSLKPMFTPSILVGSTVLAIAVLIACSVIARSASLPSDLRLSLKMLALVVSWIGAFIFCLGARAWRQASFPLLFLFCLVPLPQFALNWIVAVLQLGSAWAAFVLFSIFGIPVTQDGVLLTIPGLTVQVAQECSSIRSSSMLLVTTIVLAQLLLRSPWRKALVIGLAVPLSVAKNGLRVFTIAMLGTRVDRGYLTGKFHHNGGIVFFAIALLTIFALLWALRRGEDLSLASRLTPVNAAAAAD